MDLTISECIMGALLGLVGGPIGAVFGWLWSKFGVYLIIAGVIAALVFGAYFYIKSTNKTIDTLRANLITEQDQVNALTLANKNMQQQALQNKAIMDDFNRQLSGLQTQTTQKQRTIAIKNYKKEALKNSKASAVDLNNDWLNMNKDLETLTK